MAGPGTEAPWVLGVLSLPRLWQWLARYSFQLHRPLPPSHSSLQHPTAFALGCLPPAPSSPAFISHPSCHLFTTKHLSNIAWRKPSMWPLLGTHIPCLSWSMPASHTSVLGGSSHTS